LRALRGLQTHGRRWALASAAFGLHQVLPSARGAHLEAAARVAASPPRAFRDDLWCMQREAETAAGQRLSAPPHTQRGLRCSTCSRRARCAHGARAGRGAHREFEEQ
jgi:hypothetical protein